MVPALALKHPEGEAECQAGTEPSPGQESPQSPCTYVSRATIFSEDLQAVVGT